MNPLHLFPRFEVPTAAETGADMVARCNRNRARVCLRRGAWLALIPEPFRTWKVNATFKRGRELLTEYRSTWAHQRRFRRHVAAVQAVVDRVQQKLDTKMDPAPGSADA